MINATLVTPIHFTGFEKQETSNGPEYLFYGSNCINYYRDVHENVTSSYYKNIPDIKTCQDRRSGPDRKRPGNTEPLHPVRLYPRPKLLQDPQTFGRRHLRHQVRHQGYQDPVG